MKLMDMGMNIGDVMVDEGHAVSTAERVRQFPSVTSIASTASSSGNVDIVLSSNEYLSTLQCMYMYVSGKGGGGGGVIYLFDGKTTDIKE